LLLSFWSHRYLQVAKNETDENVSLFSLPTYEDALKVNFFLSSIILFFYFFFLSYQA